MGITTRNATWMRKAFLLASDNMSDKEVQELAFSEAMFRPYDTSPGGYEVLNPFPQFTRYADIKVDNPMIKTFGVGRWYDETYGQYQQKIYMRFGVPQFNSMASFFTGFYNSHASLLARTGRGDADLAYTAGRVITLAVTIFNLPLLAISTAVMAKDFLLEKPRSKFYYFKSAMHLYWNMVTTMVNHYCVDRGIIPRYMTSEESQRMSGENAFDPEEAARIGAALEVFTAQGQVDVYRYATLAHRRKKKFMDKLKSAMDTNNLDFPGLSNAFRGVINGKTDVQMSKSFVDYMNMWRNSSSGQADAVSTDGVAIGTSFTETTETSNAEKESFLNLVKTELDDGAAFICLRVNSTGEVSESFSSSTGASPVAAKINDRSTESRRTTFALSGGNVLGLLNPITDAVKSFASGVLDQLNIAGIAALGGAALVDIPDHWESSVAQLPAQSYTMTLASPYGNAISQLFAIYVPLFMILAGGLPRSTGRQSYTSPFICQLFDRGKQQTRLGIIDSISVRRGVTNLAFNKHMSAMGIEVTFSVKDLSTIMHAPISEGFSFNPTRALFDEDTVWSDYMASLAGLDVDDQIYPMRKFALNLTRWATHWSTWTNSSHIASFMANATPLRFGSIFFKGIDP
jgi:hypothetical protein